MTGIIKTDQLQGAQSSTIAIPSGNNLTVGGTLGVTGAITGTLATAAQTNITSVGTLTNFRSTGIDDNADAITLEITSSEDVIIKHGTNNSKLQFNDQSNSSGFYIQQIGSSGDPALRFFDTTVGERMRIDTSGHVLVGTTDQNDTGGSAGIRLKSYGRIGATVDGGISGLFNRLTSNGDIVGFYKDGSAVGIIGVEGGDSLFLQSGTSNGSGLLCHGAGAKILPVRNSTSVDATIDLGQGNRRFKDLYLSSGVFLGGTGSANELTDYEEGTFTPTLVDSAGDLSPNYTFQAGQYTKVGNKVTFALRINSNSHDSDGDQLYIGGLPFAINFTNTSNRSYVPVDGNGLNIDAGSGYYKLVGQLTNTNQSITLLQQGDSVAQNNFRAYDLAQTKEIYVTGTYFTNS